MWPGMLLNRFQYHTTSLIFAEFCVLSSRLNFTGSKYKVPSKWIELAIACDSSPKSYALGFVTSSRLVNNNIDLENLLTRRSRTDVFLCDGQIRMSEF